MRSIFSLITTATIVITSILVLLPSSPALSAPEGFYKSVIVGTGLTQPITMEFAPDGRLFILERTGAVKIYKNGELLEAPFVKLPAASNGDRGLIGIAFDPLYEENKYVYFYYAGSDNYNYVVRFNASEDIATENPTILYQTTSPSERLHVGGTLSFGPDGKLYLAIGDNGYPPNAQDLSNPFGKILRLNKDGSIPEDNPFYYDEDAEKAIWAYGFRNPWRYQFDQNTGALFLGDVGEDTWEEINIVERGNNYGWPSAEGVCNCGFTDPIYAYPHSGPSSAITMGPTYYGTMFPTEYQGNLFFGDYGEGFIKVYTKATGETFDFDLNAGSIVDLKTGQDGSLWALSIFPGQLIRYSYSEGNQPPAVFATATPNQGEEPLNVQFSSGGTFDPEGDNLTYIWEFGDGTSSTEPNPTKTYTERGTYIALLSVSDPETTIQSLPLTIQVGITPDITIIAPAVGTTYRAGDTIFYNAEATDYLGQPLPDEAFTTTIYHHRGSHIHPHEGPLLGVRSGEFIIPTFGKADPDQWYEIRIEAKDEDGLIRTESKRIDPVLSTYTVSGTIDGTVITIDGTPWETPKEVLGLVGFEQELSIPFIQQIGEELYRFTNWSQGGARTQTITMEDEAKEYVAELMQTVPYQAEYFDTMTLSGAPVLTRQETDINYTWKYQAPADSVPGENFSVRWTKTESFTEGLYEFSLTTDDGMRVFIDGTLVYDAWYDQSPTVHTFTHPVTSGEHTLVVEYYENQWEARAQFEYQRVGDLPTLPDTQYLFEIWNYEGWQTPVVPTREPEYTTQVDEIQNNWGREAPAPGISEDKFIARWSRSIELTAGTYTFETISDDGVRVFLNGDPIIDEWNDHGATLHQAEITISEGVYDLVIEYYENGWDAVCEFRFYKETIPDTPPTGNFRAQYWNSSIFQIPSRTADHTEEISEVDFNWGRNAPAPEITEDKFVARYSSIQDFAEGEYLVQTTSDDGVRVYIDGEIVINNWTDHGATVDQTIVPLSGEHEVIMEYYENGWDAVARLKFILQ